MAQAIAYGVIDPTTNKPYLSETNSSTSFSQVLSWNSDGQDTALIPNLSRSSLISDGGQLEEEFSNRRAFSQFNPGDNKAKFYKVAKPKLVGSKNHKTKDIPQQQKNIKEFFKGVNNQEGDGTVGSKIRDFFKNKITKRDTMTSEDLEEKLAPSESLDPDEYESPEELPENSNKENEESKLSHVSSFLKRQDSYSNGYNFYFNKNSECLFKNSKNVSKAFKVPTAVKREASTDQIEEEAPEKNLKRKYEETITSAFNEFAFKVNI